MLPSFRPFWVGVPKRVASAPSSVRWPSFDAAIRPLHLGIVKVAEMSFDPFRRGHCLLPPVLSICEQLHQSFSDVVLLRASVDFVCET